MNNRIIASVAAGIALVICFIALLGATHKGSESPVEKTPKERTLTILNVDYSESTQSIRSQLMAEAYELATNLDQNNSDLVVNRFGHSVEEIYTGNPSEDEDAFALMLSDAVKGSDPIGGTQYPLMLQNVYERVKSSPQKYICIIICGDGLNDFAGDAHYMNLYREAARKLASNPKVKFIRFFGVEKGAHEELYSIFKGYESKLQIRTIGQGIGD